MTSRLSLSLLISALVLTGCDAITRYRVTLHTAQDCAQAAAPDLTEASASLRCGSREDAMVRTGVAGEFELGTLSMQAGTCRHVIVRRADHEDQVVDLEPPCDACTVEVPVVLSCESM